MADPKAQALASTIDRSIQRYHFKWDDVNPLVRVAADSVENAVGFLDPLERNKWASTPMPAVLHQLQAWLKESDYVPIDAIVRNEEGFPVMPPRTGFHFLRNAVHEIAHACTRIAEFLQPDPQHIPILNEDDDVLNDAVANANLALKYCRDSAPVAISKLVSIQWDLLTNTFPEMLPPIPGTFQPKDQHPDCPKCHTPKSGQFTGQRKIDVNAFKAKYRCQECGQEFEMQFYRQG
jgi:hypothetical protein